MRSEDTGSTWDWPSSQACVLRRYGSTSMARYPRSSGPPPPPLPPVARTVGQLVAEALKVFGANLWKAVLVGVPAAAVNVVATELSRLGALVFVLAAGSVLLTASFLLACSIVHGVPLWSRAAAIAFLTGVIVFLPFPFLASVFILPGLVWLAFVGLAIPAALVERLGVVSARRRGVELARADYAHALGGLAPLTILVFVTQGAVFFLLREYADNSQRVAATLAYVVIAPVLFLGAAILYTDQAARVGTTREERDALRRSAIGGRGA